MPLDIPEEDLQRCHDLFGILSWRALKGQSIFITGGPRFIDKWLLATLLDANEKLNWDCSITVLSRDPAAFKHRNLIGNRMLFGGNLVRQPAIVQLKQGRPEAVRVEGGLADSDQIMTNTLFLGTYPGLTAEMLQAKIGVIQSFAIGQRHG